MLNDEERKQLHDIFTLIGSQLLNCEPHSWNKAHACRQLGEQVAALVSTGKQMNDDTSPEQQVKDLEEVLADKRKLTRELDVALCGEAGAAEQASLCDLIPIAKKARELLDRAYPHLDNTLLQDEIRNFLYGDKRE